MQICSIQIELFSWKYYIVENKDLNFETISLEATFLMVITIMKKEQNDLRDKALSLESHFI